MKTLLLHGWGWDGNENWFPWLKDVLKEKNIDFIAPKLPNSDTPKLEEQLGDLEKYKHFFDGKEGIIVGHSLGCKLALHFVEKYKLKNIKLVLVAPVYPGVAEICGKEVFEDAYDYIKQYFDAPIDFENFIIPIEIITSDNDPFLKLSQVEAYYQKFQNSSFTVLPGKWHINRSAGVTQLPEILPFI